MSKLVSNKTNNENNEYVEANSIKMLEKIPDNNYSQRLSDL